MRYDHFHGVQESISIGRFCSKRSYIDSVRPSSNSFNKRALNEENPLGTNLRFAAAQTATQDGKLGLYLLTFNFLF